jgi:tRNA modification GTPase
VVDAAEGWTPEDQGILEEVVLGRGGGGSSQGGGSRGGAPPPALLVINKSDLADVRLHPALPDSSVAGAFAAVVRTSATTGEGLEELRRALLAAAGAPELAPGGVAWAVNERQGEALLRASEALGRALGSVEGALPLDFWTIDIRAAALALGEVGGEEVAEEVLDAVFARFCIGK